MLENRKAKFHLPGLFEFYELYSRFLPIFFDSREYFYDYVEISSIYGAPKRCLWSGGRLGLANDDSILKTLELLEKYNISARLTFSNSLLEEKHLSDERCNKLCRLLNDSKIRNGVIIHSDLLLDYLKEKYPNLYFVSSTTKVITDFDEFVRELDKEEFEYVVPDFRLNKKFNDLNNLFKEQKDKVEFLANECCYIGCNKRKECYKNVSQMVLDEDTDEFECTSKEKSGYKFSNAMKNPSFISNKDITDIYLPNDFTNFKIEGRGLGSALVLEFLLYYLVKPEYQLNVREMIYLDSDLDLF